MIDCRKCAMRYLNMNGSIHFDHYRYAQDAVKKK